MHFRSARALALTLLASASVAACATGVTIRVPSDFEVIQDGLDAASSGDTVLVAAGTYEEFLVLGADDDGVALVSESGPDSTVLQGSNSGYTLVRFGGVGSQTRLEGFTLRDNRYGSGGAIVCQSGASPEIRGNIFIGNHGGDAGGAIACIASSSPRISGNVFRENTAGEGGAISVAPAGDVEISLNVFEDNTASYFSGDHGGAISVWGAAATIVGNSFRGNQAGSRGGAILGHDASLTTAGNTYWGNSAGDGGAVCIESGSSCSIVGSNFSQNAATDGSPSGGAVLCDGSSTLVGTDIVFFSNVAARGRSLAVTDASGPITLTACSFVGSLPEEVYVVSSAIPCTLEATGCWWGTADGGSIPGLIWDCEDDPAVQACVNFADWCTDAACSGQATSVPESPNHMEATWGRIKSIYR